MQRAILQAKRSPDQPPKKSGGRTQIVTADLGDLVRTGDFRRTEPTPSGLALIRHLASKGMTEASIMHCVGVSGPTWQRWKERYPQLIEVLEQGKAVGVDRATEVIHRHILAGDLVAAMFYTKANAGWRDHGTSEAPPRPPQELTGQLRRLTDEELAQIAAIVKRAAGRAIVEGAAPALGGAVPAESA